MKSSVQVLAVAASLFAGQLLAGPEASCSIDLLVDSNSDQSTINRPFNRVVFNLQSNGDGSFYSPVQILGQGEHMTVNVPCHECYDIIANVIYTGEQLSPFGHMPGYRVQNVCLHLQNDVNHHANIIFPNHFTPS